MMYANWFVCETDRVEQNNQRRCVVWQTEQSAGELYFTARTDSNGRHVVFFQYYWRNNDD